MSFHESVAHATAIWKKSCRFESGNLPKLVRFADLLHVLKSFDSRSDAVDGLFKDVKQKVLQITIDGEPVRRSAEPDSPPILGSLSDCEAREILPC